MQVRFLRKRLEYHLPGNHLIAKALVFSGLFFSGDEAEEMWLDNVRFVPRQAKEDMPGMWSLCDISLIQLKNDPLFASVIPSKIFESMGMGLPIILSLPIGRPPV